MSDTKEVDTQVTNNLNTETDLDNEYEDQDQLLENEDDNTSNENDSIDSNIIESLDDDQFVEYLNSGKLPEGINIPKKEIKEGDDNDESSDEQSGERRNSNTGNERNRSSREEEDQTRRTDDSRKKTEVRKDNNTNDNSERIRTDKESGNSSSSDRSGRDSVKVTDEEIKSAYESIFKPFKANGKMITPRTVDDVISLMQMGSNYTQKMQQLQPIRKIAESVSRAGINEEELSFLIDIHNGDKEAIKKLLKKHEVDPLDIDLDSTNYVPKNNLVSDEDIEYSSALQDAQSSLPKIQEIMNKTWDQKSKDILLSDPTIVTALHEEIEMGRFDEVQARLEIEKTFGRYKGVPDIKAYTDVLTKMIQEQSFSNTNINTNISNNKKPTNTPNKNIPDKSKAAPTKSTKTNTNSNQLTAKDIFSMPEEEFMKLSMRNLV